MSNILVIGDSCTDVFIYGNIERICPEAPVPVINPLHTTENGGMSKNVKSNVEALGDRCGIITNGNKIRKVRYVDSRSNQLVLRVDENDRCDRIDTNVIKRYDDFDAVIISDYCKGFLLEEDIKNICDTNDNVFIDTKKQLGDWASNAKFIKINEFEHKKNYEIIPNYPSLESKLIVTRGRNGCDYLGTNYPVEDVSVKDVSGAGDTFLSGLVVEYVKSNDIDKAIKFAQECTTKVVQKHGVSTI